MNIKLHTPKSLQNFSGMGSLKQFFMSIIATSISIVLTFGTAAIIDNNKKQEAKHEMALVLLYDMASTIDQVESADSMLYEGFKKQLAVARNPKLLDPYTFIFYIPTLEYTETVEHIFSSSIESINTLGNVLFAENVSEFYRLRKQYKTFICDEFKKEFESNNNFTDLDKVLQIEFGTGSRPFISGTFLMQMKELFSSCKQMMDVSDAELEAYRHKRSEDDKAEEHTSQSEALLNKTKKNAQLLNEALTAGAKQQ